VFFLLFIYKIYITFGCDFIFGLWTLVFFLFCFFSLVGCFFFTYLFIYKHTGVVFIWTLVLSFFSSLVPLWGCFSFIYLFIYL